MNCRSNLCLEVAAEMSGVVELRFDPTPPDALPRVFVDGAFVCDTVELDRQRVYRNLADELGLRRAHRRDTLWRDLKRTLLQLVDEHGIIPILVIDEAQHLADDFFRDPRHRVRLEVPRRPACPRRTTRAQPHRTARTAPQ